MQRNILISIEYDGTNFHGWQRQPEQRTVQGTLEKVISSVLGKNVSIRGVSRTDARVHAHCQMAQFRTELLIPLNRLKTVINNALAKEIGQTGIIPDINIKELKAVNFDFDIKKEVGGKKYSYFVETGSERDITHRNTRYFVDDILDIAQMRTAARALEGCHDFSAFKSAGGDPDQDPNKTIYSIDITAYGENGTAEEAKSAESVVISQKLRFDFYGDSFMYNQVRIMVGTLIDVGRGRIGAGSLYDILEGKDRQKAGHTAPPQGLFLEKIYLNEEWDEIRRTYGKL